MKTYYKWAKENYSYLKLTSYTYIGVVKRGSEFYYVFIDQDYHDGISNDDAFYFEVSVNNNTVTAKLPEKTEKVKVSNGKVTKA